MSRYRVGPHLADPTKVECYLGDTYWRNAAVASKPDIILVMSSNKISKPISKPVRIY